MTDNAVPTSELILYQTEDGRTRIECRFEGETVWLTQALIAELFQTTPQNITQHLREIYAEGELDEAATCKSFLQVRTEGGRQVSRSLRFYNLDAIIAIGYRVRSARGTQFRKWATARLSEYLVKGFTMDDERLKNPPGPGATDYFEELLERIRDIRASERRFYQKVLDIYATSIDYEPDTELPQQRLSRQARRVPEGVWPEAARSRGEHLRGNREGESGGRVRALQGARGREATRDRCGVRDGREAAQEASATAEKATKGNVVKARGERRCAANRVAKIGPVSSPRFLPCPVSPRREHHALDVERVHERSAMLSTSRRRPVDKMKKYGLNQQGKR